MEQWCSSKTRQKTGKNHFQKSRYIGWHDNHTKQTKLRPKTENTDRGIVEFTKS